MNKRDKKIVRNSWIYNERYKREIKKKFTKENSPKLFKLRDRIGKELERLGRELKEIDKKEEKIIK